MITSFRINRVVRDSPAKTTPSERLNRRIHFAKPVVGVGKYWAKARKVAGRRLVAANAK
jgi:hypothetical protein